MQAITLGPRFPHIDLAGDSGGNESTAVLLEQINTLSYPGNKQIDLRKRAVKKLSNLYLFSSWMFSATGLSWLGDGLLRL